MSARRQANDALRAKWDAEAAAALEARQANAEAFLFREESAWASVKHDGDARIAELRGILETAGLVRRKGAGDDLRA